jgi:hypothetical protein
LVLEERLSAVERDDFHTPHRAFEARLREESGHFFR